MTPSIREYGSADLEACRGLWRDLTQRHRDIYADPSIGGDDPGLQFDTYIENPKLAGPWVAEADSKVVALTGLLVQGQEAEIEPVVVAPDFRSQGLGSRLLEFLTQEAQKRGVTILSIRPVVRNIEAITCFHRAGFRILGHLDMFLDLRSKRDSRWKQGVTIHGHEFEY